MDIRSRLSLRFTLIFTAIIIAASIVVYIFSDNFRKEQFYTSLNKEALTTARLLIKVEEVDSLLLKIIHRNSVALDQEQVLVFDPANQEIFNTADTHHLAVGTAMLDRIRQEGQVRFREGDIEALGLVYSQDNSHFVVLASACDTNGLSKLRYLAWLLIIVSLVCILVTSIAGWFYAGQVLRPISRIVEQVNQITASKLDARLDEGNRLDEIARLAITFNEMLSRLEAAFKIQRNFVSYASHELRTPLTAITAQLEVMLEKDREPAHYRLVAHSILEDTRQMSALSNGLLNLANTYLDASVIQLKEVRIDELVWQAQAELQRSHPDCEVTIEFENFPEHEDELVLQANEHLLKVAIINLLDNACKYSGGKRVELAIATQPQAIELKVTDRGIGIPEEELNRIFQAFYRAHNARNIKGHGLGMTLTHRIINLHKGKIHITSRLDEGTSVQVILPTASKVG